MRQNSIGVAVMAGGLLMQAACFANEKQVQAFEQTFFSEFSVQTALDMVKVIPAFQPDYGKNVRGLAGGGGNILIDGKRPSIKSGNMSDLLQTIPVKDIARIELILGSSGAGDAAQQSKVLNIIRVVDPSSLHVDFGVGVFDSASVKPRLSLSYSDKFSDWRFQINSTYLREDSKKHSIVTMQESLTPSSSRYFQLQRTDLHEFTVASNASRSLNRSDIDIYSKIKWSNYHPVTSRSTQGSQTAYFINDRDSAYILGEIGADYSYQLDNNWQSRWQGIYLVNHWDVERLTLDAVTTISTSEDVTRFDYLFDRNKSESIIKGSWSNSSLYFKPEFGVEIALNKSKFRTDYQKTAFGVVTPISLTAGNVNVMELRSELYARASYPFTSNVTLNYALAAEFSELSVNGDSKGKQLYQFLKPSLALVYKANSQWTWETRLERSVEQLNFKLFAAQSDQVDNRNDAGNPTLSPDSKVSLTSQVSGNFNKDIAFSFSVFHDWRNDVLEQVVLPTGGIGTGNAGDARAYGLNAQITLDLKSIIKNSQLSIAGESIESEYDDHYRGTHRSLTGNSGPSIEVSFRQDNILNGLSWGVNYKRGVTTEYYYINEFKEVNASDEWQLFVEREFAEGWRLKLDVSQLTNSDLVSRRWFYTRQQYSVPMSLQTESQKTPWQAKLTASLTF